MQTKKKMFHHVFLLLISIVSVRAGYSYFSNTVESDNGRSFHQTQNVAIDSGKIVNTKVANTITGCYKRCHKQKDKCQCMNIKEVNGKYNCEMSESCDGPFKKEKGSLFASRKAPKCSGYCENLSYLNLCQNCKCVDNCGKKTPYYCNCTQVLAPMKDCTEVLKAGYFRSGVYLIKPDDDVAFPVFCDMKGDPFGKVSAWMIVIKLLNPVQQFLGKKLDSYKIGFKKLSDDNYWLGLDKLQRITTSSPNMVMRTEMVVSDVESSGEYEEFSVTDQDYKIKYSNFEMKRGNIKQIFQNGKTFKKCKDMFWWHDCGSNQAIHVTATQRVKLMLRSKVIGETKKNPGSTCIDLKEKKYPNGYYWVDSNEKTFCDMNYEEGPGQSQRSAIKSCKWLRQKYSDSESGFYWTVLSELTKVFCDMKTEVGNVKGGWTMIGNVVHTSALIDGFDFKTTIQNDITALERVVTESFFLTSPGLKKLDEYISFSQMRFFCTKKIPGRVFHISTTDDDKGKAVVEFFKGVNNHRPEACRSYTRMDDDNSDMADDCSKAGGDGRWSNADNYKIKERLWLVPFHISQKDFALFEGKLNCGDTASDVNQGEWKVFVR